MTWRMMQWLLATIFVILSPAELRVSKQSTTGQQSSHPVSQPVAETGARHLQDCEVIGWAELCERKKLTAGSCFQLQPTAEAPLCELQGPHGAPAQLRPATAGILTLTSGELRITGQIQMTSLRLAAKTVNFADAHVEAWHEAPSDPNSTSGGAFFSEGSFTLTRSRLTVRDVRATTMDGGGFAADGDLNVRQDSEVVIENVSAKSGAGFLATENVYISDGCSSFDVALEMGKKIESLQVETCEASSEENKNDIFQYIISELGSLERMDEQIRALMAEMLMQNLANMEKATGSLVDRLGQGSATVATLNEKRLKPHVASGIRQIFSI